jgi:hypothetical protein
MADERGYSMRVPGLAQSLQLATLRSVTDNQSRQPGSARESLFCPTTGKVWLGLSLVLDERANGGLKTRKLWSTRPGLVQTSRILDKFVVVTP